MIWKGLPFFHLANFLWPWCMSGITKEDVRVCPCVLNTEPLPMWSTVSQNWLSKHGFVQIYTFLTHVKSFRITATTSWYHDMETLSALLVLCVGNPLVNSRLPSKKPEMQCWFTFSLMLAWSSCFINSRVASVLRHVHTHVMFSRNLRLQFPINRVLNL